MLKGLVSICVYKVLKMDECKSKVKEKGSYFTFKIIQFANNRALEVRFVSMYCTC